MEELCRGVWTVEMSEHKRWWLKCLKNKTYPAREGKSVDRDDVMAIGLVSTNRKHVDRCRSLA